MLVWRTFCGAYRVKTDRLNEYSKDDGRKKITKLKMNETFLFRVKEFWRLFCYLITDISVLTMSHSNFLLTWIIKEQQQKRAKKKFFQPAMQFPVISSLVFFLFFFLQCICLACVFQNFNLKTIQLFINSPSFIREYTIHLKFGSRSYIKKNLNIYNGDNLINREGVETS